MLSIVTVQIYIPTKGSSFSTSSITFSISYLFGDSHFNRYEETYGGSFCISLLLRDVEYPYTYLLAICMSCFVIEI